MGIPFEGARRILATVQRLGLSGEVLTLGRQAILFSLQDLFELFDERTLNGERLYPCYTTEKLRPILDDLMQDDELLSNFADKRKAKFISDRAFFRLIGFDSIISVDKSDYEQADVLYNLNLDVVPAGLAGRFDLVFDGGTIEHVFHVPNVFKNIFAFLKVGGVVIHQAPTNNYVDHGLYQISPTLFVDYYQENGYRLEECQFYYALNADRKAPWFLLDYRPGNLASSSSLAIATHDSGLGPGSYGTSFVARKKETTRCDQIPNQGSCIRAWSGSSLMKADCRSLIFDLGR